MQWWWVANEESLEFFGRDREGPWQDSMVVGRSIRERIGGDVTEGKAMDLW